jgi:anti-sigma regulatory factor (Ser/Thr protein kinase)
MPAVDEIVLTIPRERQFYGVAHLVLGGLGSRLNLTLEHLEDLQLGLDSLLAQQDGQEDVTLRIRVLDGAIETEIGPFPVAFSQALEEGGSTGVGLRRILDTVSDEVRLGERDGASWVTLTKQVNGSGA